MSMARHEIDVIEKGEGWLIVKLRDEAAASPRATTKLHDKLFGWLHLHRGTKIRAALPFVSGGETIAVQGWTDQPKRE